MKKYWANDTQPVEGSVMQRKCRAKLQHKIRKRRCLRQKSSSYRQTNQIGEIADFPNGIKMEVRDVLFLCFIEDMHF